MARCCGSQCERSSVKALIGRCMDDRGWRRQFTFCVYTSSHVGGPRLAEFFRFQRVELFFRREPLSRSHVTRDHSLRGSARGTALRGWVCTGGHDRQPQGYAVFPALHLLMTCCRGGPYFSHTAARCLLPGCSRTLHRLEVQDGRCNGPKNAYGSVV